MKNVCVTWLLLILILVVSLEVHTIMAASEFCDSKCSERCSKAGRQNRCLKYCGICCEECHCVPSGTSGNKDECPCYRDKKNSKGFNLRPCSLVTSHYHRARVRLSFNSTPLKRL